MANWKGSRAAFTIDFSVQTGWTFQFWRVTRNWQLVHIEHGGQLVHIEHAMMRITRSSTCLELGLPNGIGAGNTDLRCDGCRNHESFGFSRRRKSRAKRNACHKPWSDRYRFHKESTKRRTAKLIQDFLEGCGATYEEEGEKSDKSDESKPKEENEENAAIDQNDPDEKNVQNAGKHADSVQAVVGSMTPEQIATRDEVLESISKELFEDWPGSNLEETHQEEEEPPMKKRRAYRRTSSDVKAGSHVVKEVPSNFSVTLKSHITKLKQDAKRFQRLAKAFKHERFSWGTKASFFLAAGFSQVPQASHYAID